ncbi:hypothetical protein HOV93_03450 [Planctomycetes bacterium FF15]|uniref:Uncharacterized protein n=1 Tax=Bremerella alba TaxID=980252 RepID=A0A7V9A5S5_9BACT|nr:hypothetical protein [Bremerella alba]
MADSVKIVLEERHLRASARLILRERLPQPTFAATAPEQTDRERKSMILKESTWTKMTQVVLPGLVLFSALAYMHGPSYVAYFQKELLAYRMPRESLWGPVKYNVRLKADFVSEFGDDCQVYVLTDLKPAKNESTNREELILVDKWSQIVDRQIATDVGAIRSTHLSPQDGYAMLEVIRIVPENRRQAEIVHYQVTAKQIAMVESETRDLKPHWDNRSNSARQGRGDNNHRGRRRGDQAHPTPEQIEEWERRRERWEQRRRQTSDVVQVEQSRGPDGEENQTRRERKKRDEETKGLTQSKNKKDIQRTRPMGTDHERLLDVSRLGRTGDKTAELVLTPR